MDFNQFKNKLLTYCEQNKNSDELKKKIELRQQFNEEFPIETLKKMALSE